MPSQNYFLIDELGLINFLLLFLFLFIIFITLCYLDSLRLCESTETHLPIFCFTVINDTTTPIGWWNDDVTSCNAAFTAYFVSQSILLFQSNSRNEDMEWRHSDGEGRPGFLLPKGHKNINHHLFLPWRVLVQYLSGMISGRTGCVCNWGSHMFAVLLKYLSFKHCRLRKQLWHGQSVINCASKLLYELLMFKELVQKEKKAIFKSSYRDHSSINRNFVLIYSPSC